MIVVSVQLKVKPEQRETFLQALAEDAVISRKFEGCQMFKLYEDVDNEAGYILYEEWTSLAAFDAYRHSEHQKNIGSRVFPLIDGQPTSSYYEAALIA